MFSIGQKIVCIISFPDPPELKELIKPIKDEIYTVRESYTCKRQGREIPTCTLVEINNVGKCMNVSFDGREHGFGQMAFREALPEECLQAEIDESLKRKTPLKKRYAFTEHEHCNDVANYLATPEAVRSWYQDVAPLIPVKP